MADDTSPNFIQLRGIREAGLDGIDLRVPLRRVVRICGGAGSGSEAVARRVLLGESRRRYLLSLSPFERERVGGIGIQAAVDGVDRLPPAQSLPAPAAGDTSVASRLHLHTELVRVTKSRARVFCPHCSGSCVAFHEEDIARFVEDRFVNESVLVIAPMQLDADAVLGVVGELERAGFRRVRVDGEVLRIDAMEADRLSGTRAMTDGALQVVVDRLSPTGLTRSRLGEAVRTARAIAAGRTLLVGDAGQHVWADSRRACIACGQLVEEPEWDDLVRGTSAAPLVRINDQSCAELLAELRLGAMEELLGDLEDGPARRLRQVSAICRELSLAELPVRRPVRDLAHGEQLLLGIAGARALGLTGVLHVVLSPPSALDRTTRRLVYDGLQHLVSDGSSVVVLDADLGVEDRVDDMVALGPTPSVDPMVVSTTAVPTSLNEVEQLVVAAATAGEDRVPVHKVVIPLGQFVAVVGPTGSGKSQLLRLVRDGLSGKSVARRVQGPAVRRVFDVTTDGAKAGSRLAELLAVHRPLARVFAESPVAREHGLSTDHFLLEKPGGRCTMCEGQGIIRHELDLVEGIEVTCLRCSGRRFRDEVLAVTAHGVTIAEAYAMTVSEAEAHFTRERSVKDVLAAAMRCGLGGRQLDVAPRNLDRVELLFARLARQQVDARHGDLILADHPLAGCDPSGAACIANALRRLVTAGASVMAVDADGRLTDFVDAVIALEAAPFRRLGA
jgi:excinuclease ABC subunit A